MCGTCDQRKPQFRCTAGNSCATTRWSPAHSGGSGLAAHDRLEWSVGVVCCGSFNTVNDRLNAEIESRGVENVAVLREIQNAQINHLAMRLAPKIDAGDTMAIATAIRLLERSAKLNDLDAPLKGEIVGELEVSTMNIIPGELLRKADDAAHDSRV